jgi:hypothetical protein
MFISRFTFFICFAMIGMLFLESSHVSAMPVHSTRLASSPRHREGADVAVQVIGVFISRSTNSCAITLAIRSTGDVTLFQCQNVKLGSLPLLLVTSFFRDVVKAEPLSSLPQSQGCVKSVSFGTKTVIAFLGDISPDISCSRDKVGLMLYHDVLAIRADLHL